MKIKGLLVPLVVSAAVLLPSSIAYAAESSSSVSLTSNYVFRGQTQTKDDPAVQADFLLEQEENEGWYTGAFASTVAKGLELDVFAGWKGLFSQQSNMGYDVGIIRYIYTKSSFSPDITELYAGVNYETAYVKLYNGQGSGISSYNYLDIGASFIVLDDLDLELHFGRYISSPSSSDVSANLAFDVKDFNMNLGVTYENEGADNDVVFFVTVGKSFE